jgi:hypothetical protein
MLIVVAILVALVSLGWPSFRVLAEKRELLSSARTLRGTLLRARLDAIQSGRVYQLRCCPNTPVYQVGPVEDQRAVSDEALIALGPEDAEMPLEGPASDGAGASAEDQRLPAGVLFLAPDQPPDELPEAAGGTEAAGAAADSDWSEPLLFYPNGRTFNARVVLASRRFRVELAIRGLTGSVSVGEVVRVEQTQQDLPEFDSS